MTLLVRFTSRADVARGVGAADLPLYCGVLSAKRFGLLAPGSSGTRSLSS